MIKIRVPATTANLGPGFDTIGMALSLYNEVTLEVNSNGAQEVHWLGPELVPDRENLVLTSLRATLSKLGQGQTGFTLTMGECEVPLSRGLGSSAASIVAGVLGANALCDNPMSSQDLVDWVTAIEGHPDNVVPALLGGLVISFSDQGAVFSQEVSWPEDLTPVALIPEYQLSTKEARAALPSHYTREDCIYNISRMGYVIAALQNQSFHGLQKAFKDRIHQPYRIDLIPDGQAVMDTVQASGALATMISGAGPTLIALFPAQGLNLGQLEEALGKFRVHWSVKPLKVCSDGAQVEVIST